MGPMNRNTRMTRQRRVILDELHQRQSHPTAEELYQIVRRRLPRISFTRAPYRVFWESSTMR